MPSDPELRVFLAGRVAVEADGVLLGEDRFPGRQGRLLFACLVAKQGRPVPRDELAEALWGDAVPATWEKALTVLVSKLRALLAECGLDGTAAITGAFGCYRLNLPERAWVDVMAAAEALREAEAALATDDLDQAKTAATRAASLARPPFVPGEEGAWVEGKRRELMDILRRALSCLAEACLRSGDDAEAAKWAEETIVLDPFRETGYRRLMAAHAAAGNRAEALRVYERCRVLLATELGAYPSPETESIYRELLRGPSPEPGAAPSEAAPVPALDQEAETVPARGLSSRRAVGGVVLALALGAVAAIALVGASRDEAPPEVLPNSLVRIDPTTLEPTKVVPIGDSPDIVVVAGGFVWVTHHVLRDTDSSALRDAGDRTLTRVDPSTGDVVVVGGGLAPCGLVADPSGDVWVANCYPSGAGPSANVVRIDATTLDFKETWPVPAGEGFYRGLAYGGGSLWVSDVAGADRPPRRYTLTQVDPRTGAQRSIPLARFAGALTWSEGYGDLWMNNFDAGSVSRMHAATGIVETVDNVAINPAFPVIDGGIVWAADWAAPQVARFRAIGSSVPRMIALPVVNGAAGVWNVAAGAGRLWATTPRDHALWRIDPKTNDVTRIPMAHLPAGLVADDDGVWVTVRAE